MKKILSILFLAFLLNVQTTLAMTYEEASKSDEPMALLIYADWASDMEKVLPTFNMTSQKYKNDYNFVKLNIASEDTKIFNKKYHIYPNIPYVILFKHNQKISRVVPKDCIIDNSCLQEKLDLFKE